MSNERIDLTKHEKVLKELEELHDERGYGFVAQESYDASYSLSDLIAELKRCYEREDALIEALRIIRDDLDETIAQGHLPIKSTDGIDATKIRNFANDASQ